MSRSPEVEAAMRYRNGPLSCALTMSDGSERYGHEILADEVERLEVALAKADEAARAAMYAVDERAFLAESAEKSEKRAETAESLLKQTEDIATQRMESCAKMLARAEAAEARVAELEAQLLDLTPTIKLALDTADLREQNARLREAYHTVRVKVVQIANGEPEEMRDALFLLTKETDSLADGKAAPS